MSEKYLGPYRLESKVGSGGMGSVFRGVHAKTGQRVAVKLIAEQVADSERFRRRFMVEVETLKKLNHPNIVRLIGYGEEDGRLFYSMDLVEGPSLQQYLKQHRRLDWRQTIQVGIDICAALKHAHDLGVIHRDLKPANLLLADGEQIRLVDFGIAKMFGAGDHTAAGAVLGTADYMAPEQAGEGKITTRTDLYALGSVLYACLAGRPPFGGKSVTTVIEALRRDTPVSLDLIVPETPEELTELVHQLLEKTPENRPPTALVVGNRLRAMRVGLDSRDAATQIDEDQQTQLEKDRSHDSIEIDPEYLVKNDTAASAKRPKTEANKAPGTHEQATLDATQLSAASAVPQRGPTVASEADGRGTTGDTQAKPVTKTSFQTVDASQRPHPSLSSDDESNAAVQQWISVALLILLLVGIVFATYRFTRPPTADQLFANIQAADARGDATDARGEIESFLRRYDDDPRAEQVRMIADTLDFDAAVRRLRLASLQRGGVNQLHPAEQAFLQAALLRDQNPAQAAEQLQHFLTVYGREGLPKTSQTERLARLVTAQLAQWDQPAPADAGDQRGKQLEDSLRWAAENLPAEDQQAFFRSVIALHGDADWAAPQVQMARRALQNLGKRRPESPPAADRQDDDAEGRAQKATTR